MAQEIIAHNNRYLLIPGTDQPQLDENGAPIPDPRFGTTETVVHADLEAAPPSWDALTFKRRFTASERIALRTLAAINGQAADFLDLLDTAAATGTLIHSADHDVVAGLAMIEAARLIGTGRAAQILSHSASP